VSPVATRVLRALLFDFDHTLADFGRWVDWRAARAELEALYAGAGVDAAAIMRRRGSLSLVDALHAAVRERHPPARAAAIQRRAFAVLERHERAGAPRAGLLPGAAASLRTAVEAGLALGIVSANAESAIRAALGRLGVEDRFGVIVGRTLERPLKPAPDMHHAALRALGCPPAAALAVGDSPHDMRAAEAAGILAVGVTGGEGGAEELFAAGACWVLADLTALPSLIAHWAEAAGEG
jgi:phosphoglycolate phosphatase